jgi:phospholipase C
MHFADLHRASWRYVGLGAALLSTMVNLIDPPSLAAQNKPVTPIQHVIVIIGENRSF